MTKLITKVRVERAGGHDHVSVWNRGGLAGVLKVCAGDGAAVAQLLRAGPIEERDVAILQHVASPESEQWHSGPGWYYWNEEYPEEGSVGSFETREEAVACAKEGDYQIRELKPTEPRTIGVGVQLEGNVIAAGEQDER